MEMTAKFGRSVQTTGGSDAENGSGKSAPSDEGWIKKEAALPGWLDHE